MAGNELSWTEQPLVTGLMIFDRPGQYRGAQYSVESFFGQSWPRKELVIFNATALKLVPTFGPRRAINEIKLRACSHELAVSVCAANSNGEWCVFWEPDCIYDGNYIGTHMAHRDKQRLVVFKHRQVYSLSDHQIAILSDEALDAWSFYRHMPDFSKPLQPQFAHVLKLDNPANAIVQFVREIA